MQARGVISVPYCRYAAPRNAPCIAGILPIPCAYCTRQGRMRPAERAILVLPVHVGGLGSRLRVFPEAAPPRRLSCFMLLLIRMSPMVKRLPTLEVMHEQSGPRCGQRMVPRQLARSADPAGAGLFGRGWARPGRGDFAPVSAAGLCR